MTEQDFLNAILDRPTLDDTRLIYADWLEEQGGRECETKALYLRTMLEIAPSSPENWPAEIVDELRLIAKALDPAWLAVVSRLPVENCQRHGTTPGFSFTYLCDMQWDQLGPTQDDKVRKCQLCNKNVYYCDSVAEGKEHARQHH